MKVNPGDRVVFSADYVNKLTDLIEAQKGQLQGSLSGNSRPSVITIKNTLSTYVEANGILGLGNSLVEPDTDEMTFRFKRPYFEGVLPVKGTHEYKFGILHKGLAQDEIGEATVFGTAIVLVDFINADHGYATIAAADETVALESAPAGPARILWASNDESDGTGKAWAAVIFPSHEAPLLYKATADEESTGTILARPVDSAGDTLSTDPEFEFKVLP